MVNTIPVLDLFGWKDSGWAFTWKADRGFSHLRIDADTGILDYTDREQTRFLVRNPLAWNLSVKDAPRRNPSMPLQGRTLVLKLTDTGGKKYEWDIGYLSLQNARAETTDRASVPERPDALTFVVQWINNDLACLKSRAPKPGG